MTAVLIAGFLSAACATQGSDLAGSRQDEVEKMLAWQFQRLGGGRMSLGELPARLTVLTFFTTWAPSCIVQLQALSFAFERRSESGLMVVGAAMDLNGELMVEPFVRRFEIRFPVVLAADGILKGTSPFGRITTVPTSFVFDQKGRLVRSYTGLIPSEELDKLLDKYAP